jgi:hypothetical protein
LSSPPAHKSEAFALVAQINASWRVVRLHDDVDWKRPTWLIQQFVDGAWHWRGAYRSAETLRWMLGHHVGPIAPDAAAILAALPARVDLPARPRVYKSKKRPRAEMPAPRVSEEDRKRKRSDADRARAASKKRDASLGRAAATERAGKIAETADRFKRALRARGQWRGRAKCPFCGTGTIDGLIGSDDRLRFDCDSCDARTDRGEPAEAAE